MIRRQNKANCQYVSTLGGIIMFCTQCGKEIADGNKFCGSCGSPVAVENFIKKEENNTQESRVQPEKDCMQSNHIKQTQNGMNEKSGTSKPHMEKKD